MIETKELVYSMDEELYHDDIDYVIEECTNEGYETVTVAEKVKYEHSDFIDVYDLINNMQNLATDQGEWAESYLDDMPKELKEKLQQVVVDFFNKNMPSPNFYTVKKPREIKTENLLLEQQTKDNQEIIDYFKTDKTI